MEATSANAIDLESMTTAEKLRLLEAVWQDLSRVPEQLPVPAWHRDLLEERQRRLRRGESHLSEWPDAKRGVREQTVEIRAVLDCRRDPSMTGDRLS